MVNFFLSGQSKFSQRRDGGEHGHEHDKEKEGRRFFSGLYRASVLFVSAVGSSTPSAFFTAVCHWRILASFVNA